MSLQQILQLVLAACVGVAFLSNLVIYFAFKAHGIKMSAGGSIKAGYIENIYRQTPKLHSPLLGLTIRLASWSKILVVLAGIAYIILRAAGRP